MENDVPPNDYEYFLRAKIDIINPENGVVEVAKGSVITLDSYEALGNLFGHWYIGQAFEDVPPEEA